VWGRRPADDAPSTYKIPPSTTARHAAPAFPNANVDTVLRSKAVGEPRCSRFRCSSPLRRDRECGDYRFNPLLDAPATGEAILKAVDAAAGDAPSDGAPRCPMIDALAWRRRAEAVAVLVTVVATKGSVPRAPGTRMLRGDAIEGTMAAVTEFDAVAIARTRRG
jgi:hypothetical protein